MHLLFADSVADHTIAELESRGHRCFGGAGSDHRGTARSDRRRRRAGGPQHQGRPRGVRGRRQARPGDPCRCRHQHHRHRGRRPARGAGLQRARPQRGRGRRAHDGVDPGPRPQDRRQRGRRAAGPLGEGDVQQGQRAARQHPRHRRPGLDRPRRGRAGGRVRDADRLPGPPRPQPSHPRPAGRARRRVLRLAPGAARLLRRGEPARTGGGGDQEPRGRRLPGRDEARRDPREHLAR